MEKGSIIVPDGFKSYQGLNEHSEFLHMTVNHGYNFADPDTGATTNHIERVWREVRENF